MLYLVIKAFNPSKLRFPLLHVDTTWKFREMIAFRDEMVRLLGLDLIVHINPVGLIGVLVPIASGSSLHTQVMKTDALKQAFGKYEFDAASGRARRDEEKAVPRSGYSRSARRGTPGIRTIRERSCDV